MVLIATSPRRYTISSLVSTRRRGVPSYLLSPSSGWQPYLRRWYLCYSTGEHADRAQTDAASQGRRHHHIYCWAGGLQHKCRRTRTLGIILNSFTDSGSILVYYVYMYVNWMSQKCPRHPPFLPLVLIPPPSNSHPLHIGSCLGNRVWWREVPILDATGLARQVIETGHRQAGCQLPPPHWPESARLTVSVSSFGAMQLWALF